VRDRSLAESRWARVWSDVLRVADWDAREDEMESRVERRSVVLEGAIVACWVLRLGLEREEREEGVRARGCMQ
jgi:hypothetical protein